MAILLDIESGGELRITPADIQANRIARIDQLQGSTLDAMLWDAFLLLGNLSVSNPPEVDIVIGAVHPTIPGIHVTNVDITPIPGCAQARADILYAVPRFDLPPGGAVDGADHKSVRYFGQPRQVTRNPRDTGSGPDFDELVVAAPANATTDYSTVAGQTKTVTVNEARGVVVFERTEPVVPTARMRTFQNKVNSLALGAGSVYPIGTLYMNVIQAVTRDQGGLYVVRYELLFNTKGHKIEFKWEVPSLPVELYDAGSRKQIEPYDEIDFTPLGLDFDD